MDHGTTSFTSGNGARANCPRRFVRRRLLYGHSIDRDFLQAIVPFAKIPPPECRIFRNSTRCGLCRIPPLQTMSSAVDERFYTRVGRGTSGSGRQQSDCADFGQYPPITWCGACTSTPVLQESVRHDLSGLLPRAASRKSV